MMRQSKNGNLPVMESMACSIPNIVPYHSAFTEWPNGGVAYIEIAKEPFFPTGTLNTKQYVPARESAIHVLDTMYNNSTTRSLIAERGYHIVTLPQFSWKNIATLFYDIFTESLDDEQTYT
jgi:glycosyltransferase involved in cell wall biosynthesis